MRLSEGDIFPVLEASRLDGDYGPVPAAVAGHWAILVFYRGDWCPYCRRQLAHFQQHLPKYAEADIKIVALTADSREHVEATRDRHHLTFPVFYGLDPAATADKIGAFLAADESYIQATSFILRPDGAVALAVYSTGAVGRLEPEDALGFIQYVRDHG